LEIGLNNLSPQISTHVLEGFLSDIRAQPLWRHEADMAADYYDGNQISAAVRAAMEERKQPVLIHNLIAPAIDGVLGLEEKTRANWKLVADDDGGLPVVDALDQELHEAARIANADKAIADAYAAQVKTGLGWVEVTTNTDPFQFPYQVSYVHRNEIWWDWHAKRADLDDARWLMRKKWVDCDALKTHFPQHADLIDQISTGWVDYDAFNELQTLDSGSPLVGAYTTQFSANLHEQWFDSSRKRAITYEVYYRVWDRKPVIKTSSGNTMLYDAKNPMHVAAVASEKVKVTVASFSRMKLAYFIGPHKVADIDSPHPHNKFPYVPFFGYREDKTGIPYGLIRRMMPAQDEINFRRSKLTYLLNIMRVIKDSDALDPEMTDEKMLDELHLPDGVINLNPFRKNASGFKVENDSGIASQQFQVLQESQKLIQDVAGIYSAFLGQESGAKSGVAIDSLVQQGTVTLAELNGNYKFARQLVGELLLANIVNDIGRSEKAVRINVNSPKKAQTIVLNERIEENGRSIINNDVLRTKMRVQLTDVAQTPGYRQQVHSALVQMVSSLPPEYQAPLIELVVETSDLSNRDEVLEQIRRIDGTSDQDEQDPQKLAELQAQKQAEQEARALEFASMKAKVDDQMATAEIKRAEAKALSANIEIDHETKREQLKKIQAETKQIITNIVKIRQEMVTKIDEDIKQLQSTDEANAA
jgi:hypothetical protein